MKKLIKLIVIACFFISFASAQTKKCFVNEGLKDKHIVYLTIDGTKASGEFTVENDSGELNTYAFTGTNLNNNLSINFTGNKLPYQLPPKAKNGIWNLKKIGDEEILQIKIYGKNYETGKYSTYFANYDSCEPSYLTLLKNNKRITFAKGSTSATVEVELNGKQDRKSFLLNLLKGQKLSVEAIGCGISFYYPNKTVYEEGTAIDMWGTQSLTQSGDYLFAISAAGETNKCTVKFSTK